MDDRSPTPTGFADLAQRISTWTTNGLFSALILVVGLGFGRQVVRWWHAPVAENGTLQSPSVLPGHSSGDRQSVSFGDLSWSVDRRTVTADRDTIRPAVFGLCEDCVSRASCPTGASGPAEANLLRSLASSQPTCFQPGQWSVYETMNVLPMAVGLRALPGRPETETSPGPETSRIAAWCVAFPMEADLWTVLCFSPASSAMASAGLPPEFPLPEGSQSLLSLKARSGGSTQVFSGVGDLADWQAFYVRWFVENGWKFSDAFHQRRGTWHGRYLNRDEAMPYVVDIQLSTCENGILAGVLVASPATAHDTAERTQ